MSGKVRPVEPLHSVVSSACVAIGYDSATKRLAVQWPKGSISYYANVSEEVAAGVIGAESIGRAVAAIRKAYPGARVSGPCEKCGSEGLGGHTCDDCGCGVHVVPERERSNPNPEVPA